MSVYIGTHLTVEPLKTQPADDEAAAPQTAVAAGLVEEVEAALQVGGDGTEQKGSAGTAA